MTEPANFAKDQKAATWIWIVVGVVVLCLCCAVVVAAIGAILYFWPAGSVIGPAATGTPELAEPTRIPYTPATPTNRPPPPGELVVEPFDPTSIPLGVYTLYDLNPAWTGRTEPGVSTWETAFPYYQPVVIFAGWCTTTQDILDQNFEHLSFTLEIDGEDIPVDGLVWTDNPGNGGTCRNYSGIVWAWPLGDHTVLQTMRFDEDINDGWGDYPAGEYVDRFEITVTE